MPSTSRTNIPTDANEGFVTETIRLFGSFSRHFQALFSLAGSETKEALGLYVRLVVMLGAALVFLFLFYIFFLLAAAFAVAWLFGWAWVWITLGFAVFHLLVAVFCATHVKKHFSTPIFTTTSEEIRKDLALLSKNDDPALAHMNNPALR
ncbi:MAG: phage holin family protein [Chthoniobacterales bacterium]